MDKLTTIKVVAARLLMLKTLRKDLISLSHRLKVENICISGTHAKETLTVSIETAEQYLIKLLSSLIPASAKIDRIASADLTLGFIGIVEGEEVTRALVLDTGEIKNITDLDPVIELTE